jgi:hypothetical protein
MPLLQAALQLTIQYFNIIRISDSPFPGLVSCCMLTFVSRLTTFLDSSFYHLLPPRLTLEKIGYLLRILQALFVLFMPIIIPPKRTNNTVCAELRGGEI